MRRPFILLILLVSLYCWLKDLTSFLFYIFHISSPHKNIVGSILGLLGVLVLLYIIKITLYKESPAQKLKDLLQTQRKREWLLLLFISSPIILLGLFRSIYPDMNYDTLHFELYLQDYDLSENKINFAPGSIRTYYFPLSERIFGLFRHILGFRLGTILNTFLLLAIFVSVYDFIKKFLFEYSPERKPLTILPALLSLFAIFADNTLFNIGSYKPDLLGVPLILELVHLVFFDKRANKTTDHFYAFLVASLTITFKLTYLPYVALLMLIYYITYFKKYSLAEKIIFPLSVILIPSIYLLYNFLETANPIFPFFNKLFHSGLYPDSNFKDLRWGPQRAYETFIYPVITYMDPTRCNEWHLYSYRLLAGYFIGLFTIVYCLLKRRKNKSDLFLRPLIYISLIAISFDYLCIVTTGYYRYGIIVEVLYGIILSLVYLYFQKKWFAYILLLVILLQSFTTFRNIYTRQLNLSWHDYRDLLIHKEKLGNNAALLLNDYDHMRDPDSALAKIDAFVSVDPIPMDGLAKLLNKNAPIYDIARDARTPDLTAQFEKNVVRGKSVSQNLVAVSNISSAPEIIHTLNSKGYLISDIHEVYPRFMRFGEPVYLLRIKYLDTGRYTITYTEHLVRAENPPDTRRDFTYPIGPDSVRAVKDSLHAVSADSPPRHTLKAFFREAPYIFDWCCMPKEYDLTINDQKFSTKDGFENHKIFSVEADHLQFHKSNDIPYLIMFQEITEKK